MFDVSSSSRLRVATKGLIVAEQAVDNALQEMSPPATAPLTPGVDVPDDIWTPREQRAFSIVLNVKKAIEAAKKEL